MSKNKETISVDEPVNYYVELETEHLRLRQWKSRDFPAYAEYYANEETARFVGGLKERPEAWRHLASVIGHWTLRGFGVWAVEEKSTNAFVGCAGLWQPEGWPELEIPYWFLPEAYESGLGAEAMQPVLEFAYERFPNERLVTYIPLEAKASIAVAEAIGGRRREVIELAEFGPHVAYEHSS